MTALETIYYSRASDGLSVDKTGWTGGLIEAWDEPEDGYGLIWNCWSDVYYDWRILPYEKRAGKQWGLRQFPILYWYDAMRYYPIEE